MCPFVLPELSYWEIILICLAVLIGFILLLFLGFLVSGYSAVLAPPIYKYSCTSLAGEVQGGGEDKIGHLD